MFLSHPGFVLGAHRSLSSRGKNTIQLKRVQSGFKHLPLLLLLGEDSDSGQVQSYIPV